ncbi:hypothetical protein ACFWJO_11345, partial [Streptomyces sp. NPDC127092]
MPRPAPAPVLAAAHDAPSTPGLVPAPAPVPAPTPVPAAAHATPSAPAVVASSARPRRAWRRPWWRAVGAGLVLAVGVALLAGCGGRPTTHHKPGTSHQEATGGNGTLLTARDSTGHRLREVPAAGAPSVRLETRPDSEGGWNVHLLVERFRFTPDSTGGAALPGRGHARLLVDGRETARAYGPWVHVPAGARTLTVRLHADDHTAWAVAGRPVEATVRLAVGAGGGGGTPASPPTPTPPTPPPHPLPPLPPPLH